MKSLFQLPPPTPASGACPDSSGGHRTYHLDCKAIAYISNLIHLTNQILYNSSLFMKFIQVILEDRII